MAVRICTAIIVEDAAAVTAAIVKGKFAMAINNRVGGRAFFESQTDASQTEFACWLVSLPQSVSLATGLATIFHPSSNGTPLWTVVVRPVACLRGAKWALRYLHFVLAKSTLVGRRAGGMFAAIGRNL